MLLIKIEGETERPLKLNSLLYTQEYEIFFINFKFNNILNIKIKRFQDIVFEN
jgi:hypothetical protein